jgi:hypothetical protein
VNDEQTTVTEDEAVDALRRANPAAPVAHDAARAARLFATATSGQQGTGGLLRRPALAIAGGLAVVAIAAVGVFAATNGGGDGSGESNIAAAPTSNIATAPTSDPDAVSVDVDGGLATSCALGYSIDTLVERDFAFDGTVVEVGVRPAPTPRPPAEGIPGAEGVTFQVHEWFRGPGGDTITLQGRGLPIGYGSITDESATLNAGDRYLVSGSDVFVWTCGFTKTYSDATANDWREAFGN